MRLAGLQNFNEVQFCALLYLHAAHSWLKAKHIALAEVSCLPLTLCSSEKTECNASHISSNNRTPFQHLRGNVRNSSEVAESLAIISSAGAKEISAVGTSVYFYRSETDMQGSFKREGTFPPTGTQQLHPCH